MLARKLWLVGGTSAVLGASYNTVKKHFKKVAANLSFNFKQAQAHLVYNSYL